MEQEIVVAAGLEPAQRLISSFISRQKKATARAYFAALGDFQAFVGAPNMAAALADLISSRGRAHELADEYIGRARRRSRFATTPSCGCSSTSVFVAKRCRALISKTSTSQGTASACSARGATGACG